MSVELDAQPQDKYARAVPFVVMPLTSFVHDHLARLGMSGDYVDNRPRAVRCVHAVVTLLEKLDVLARRCNRDVFEADAFARHYEGAAHIVQARGRRAGVRGDRSHVLGCTDPA